MYNEFIDTFIRRKDRVRYGIQRIHVMNNHTYFPPSFTRGSPRPFFVRLKLINFLYTMSLVDTVTDVNGVKWGKYQDESDATSFFYVRSE